MRRFLITFIATLVITEFAFAQIPTENLQLWLRADSVEIIAGKVSRWYDLSPNSHLILQNSEANRPFRVENSLNNEPAISFNGTTTYLDGGDILNLSTNSNMIFIIAKGSRAVLSKSLAGGATNRYSFLLGTNNLLFLYHDNILRNFEYTNTSFDNQKYNLFTIANDRVLSKNKYYINSDSIGESSIFGSQNFTSNYDFLIGAYNNSVGSVPPLSDATYGYLNGNIAEIIIVDTVSDQIKYEIENYLFEKYSPCFNFPTTLQINYGFCATALVIDSTFTDIIWSTGETNDTIFVNQTGAFWVNATDVFGRTQFDTINVQFPNPNLQNKSICLGDSVLYEPVLVGSYDYLWSDTGIESSKYYKDAGDYWLRIEDSFGCFDTVFFSITVDSFKNNISLGNDTSLCSGNSISLIEGAELCSSIFWTTNGNTYPIQTVNESGWQKIEVENAIGCTATDSIYITVVGTAPTPGYTVENLCFGDTTQFIDDSTPQADIASWMWIINDNDTLYTQNLEWVFENIGTQNIELFVETISGCTNSLEFQIEILPVPDVSFTNNQICTGLEISFESSVQVPDGYSITDYEWQIDNNTVGSQVDLIYTFNESSTYNVSLYVGLDNGCNDLFYTMVTVSDSYPLPNVFSTVYPPPCFVSMFGDEEIEFNWNVAVDALYFKILFSDELDFSNLIFESSPIFANSFYYVLTNEYDTIYWKIYGYNACDAYISSDINMIVNISPSEIPGLSLWVNADSVEMFNEKVIRMYDLSNNDYLIEQTEGGCMPSIIVSGLNSQNAINFNGTSNYLNANDILDLNYNSRSIYLIGKSNANLGCFISKSLYGGTPSRYSIWLENTLTFLYVDNSSRNISTDFDLNRYYYIQTNTNRESNQNILFVNNSNSGTIDITPDYYHNSDFNFLIGAYNNNTGTVPPQPGYYLNGEIAELIIFDTLLNDDALYLIENYLQNKYSPPVNLSYDIRVPYGFCDTAITTAYKPWFTSYAWSTGETDSIIHVNKPGVYSVTVTDIFGFESSDDIRIFYPEVNDFADTVVCFGNSVLWDAELVGDYSFAWYGSSETTQQINIDSQGDYAVIVSDTLGCQYLSDTINFSFDNYEFTASVGPADTTLCNGNRLMLVTNRPETVSYLWNTGSTSPEIVLASSGTYSVTTTNWRGCEANDAIDVTITGTVPVPLFSSDGHCAQNPVYFTDLSTSPDGTINSWTWSINGNIFSTEQNPVLSPGDIPDATAILPAGEINPNLLRQQNATARLYRVVPTENGRETESSGNIPSQTKANQTKSPTNYQVQLTISTDAGCSDFLTSPLTIYPLPAVSFSPNYFCQYAPVDFISTAQVDGGTISENIWDFNGTQQIGDNITHTFTQSGNNPITLTSTSDVGCRDSLVAEVYVKNASLPVFSTENACEGSEIYFVNNTVVLAHNLPLEWNWDFGDGSTGTGSDPAHIYENAGIYDVAVSVVWQNMCEVPATAQVEVYHNPSLSLLAEDQCINIPFHITKTEESLSGEIISYYWVFGSENPIVSTHPTPQFNSSVPGEYPVSLNIETEFGCVANAVDTVIVHGNPHASFTPSRVWGAVPMEVEFTNNSIDATGYMWKLEETSVSFEENPVHVYTTEGEFEVKMYAYSQYGCEDDTVIIIKSVIPILDVILYDLRPVMSGNYLQTNVYVINNGTLPVNNAEITLDLGDGKIFRENIEYLAPSQVLDYKFNMEVYRADGKVPEVVCTEIYAPPFEGYAETTTDDNVLCNTDVETLRVYQPYPNPATSELNLGFILEIESDLTITLINGIGEQVYKHVLSNKSGYQKHIINVSDLTPGVYYLQVVAGDEVRSFKVEVL